MACDAAKHFSYIVSILISSDFVFQVFVFNPTLGFSSPLNADRTIRKGLSLVAMYSIIDVF